MRTRSRSRSRSRGSRRRRRAGLVRCTGSARVRHRPSGRTRIAAWRSFLPPARRPRAAVAGPAAARPVDGGTLRYGLTADPVSVTPLHVGGDRAAWWWTKRVRRAGGRRSLHACGWCRRSPRAGRRRPTAAPSPSICARSRLPARPRRRHRRHLRARLVAPVQPRDGCRRNAGCWPGAGLRPMPARRRAPERRARERPADAGGAGSASRSRSSRPRWPIPPHGRSRLS